MLQQIGDGLAGAVTGRISGADELGRSYVAALRDRDSDGDAELTDSLDARLGSWPAPLLRPLRVNVAEFEGVLESEPAQGGGRVDLRSGDAIQDAQETGDLDDDDERWLRFRVRAPVSGTAISGLSSPTSTIPTKADRLGTAIAGLGSFRRSKVATSSTGGMRSPMTASAAGHEPGSPRSGTPPSLGGARPELPITTTQ